MGGVLKFADLSSQVKVVFYQSLNYPTPPKPVLSDFYMPSEDHHNRELAFIIVSMIGIGAFLWYSDK